jgi:hypothetical protein
MFQRSYWPLPSLSPRRFLMAAVQSGNPSPGPIGIDSANVAVCDPYNPMNCLTPATTTMILASGTTGAVTATMPIVAGQTNYLCGIDIEAVGGTAVVSPITITGLLGGTFTIYQAITSAATGVGFQKTWTPCLPASAAGVAIRMRFGCQMMSLEIMANPLVAVV